jgi:hypothetical protein
LKAGWTESEVSSMIDTQKEYMTLDDAMREIGVKRTTLYYYQKRPDLNIEIKTFPLDTHAYLLRSDVERIKQLREQAQARRGKLGGQSHLEAEVQALQAENAALRTENAKLHGKVKDLERQLRAHHAL